MRWKVTSHAFCFREYFDLALPSSERRRNADGTAISGGSRFSAGVTRERCAMFVSHRDAFARCERRQVFHRANFFRSIRSRPPANCAFDIESERITAEVIRLQAMLRDRNLR
jgi:hypothetical protein